MTIFIKKQKPWFAGLETGEFLDKLANATTEQHKELATSIERHNLFLNKPEPAISTQGAKNEQDNKGARKSQVLCIRTGRS